jgi:glycosyltransferase involved in cell wall biosynthesis
MACGCAVVSTENTGVVDYITNMESGLLSPIKDPQSLGENLIKLLDDDNLRIKLAENGNNNIRSYTWDNSTDELEGYFRELRIV